MLKHLPKWPILWVHWCTRVLNHDHNLHHEFWMVEAVIFSLFIHVRFFFSGLGPRWGSEPNQPDRRTPSRVLAWGYRATPPVQVTGRFSYWNLFGVIGEAGIPHAGHEVPGPDAARCGLLVRMLGSWVLRMTSWTWLVFFVQKSMWLGSSLLFDLICTPSDPPSIPRRRVEDIDGGS